VPTNLFGKFGPIVLLAVVQLVLVLAAPSTAPNATAAGGYTPYGQSTTPGATGPASTVPGATGPGSVAAGKTGPGAVSTAPGATTAGASTTGASTTGPSATSPGAAAPGVGGDTSHCVSGRQFDPGIYYYAPPCAPGKPGAADSNNGGATWQGVANNRIEVVNYVADYGAEVDAILKAQGLYYNADQAKVWNAAYANFINSHYQLYGRKIHVDTVEGNCTTVPPDYPCLIGDMDKIVSTYHPYAVFWETTVCSACFAELSRLHVVNFGGGGFSDAFHDANAPYSYDGGMSSTQVETDFASWWCSQMTSQGGTGRTAIFAGTQNARENFTNQPRVLGVTAPNDPDNENTVKNVLYPALQKDCGENVTHEFFYDQNINTATTQAQQTEEAMNTPTNPATSVACFCDPVAPQFGLGAFAQNNYWPESILGTDQTMDFDSNAQTYEDSNGSSSVACPTPSQGCPFDSTIGIGADDPQVPSEKTDAVKVYRIGAGDKSGALPIDAATLGIVWNDWAMLASLIQNTGPVLTPARMQAAAPSMGMRGGGASGHPLRGFRPGSWCWTQDTAVMYWDKHVKSPYNGKPGHYILIEGRRFQGGQYPNLKQPPAPTPAKR
jgi:hypothetical protein